MIRRSQKLSMRATPRAPTTGRRPTRMCCVSFGQARGSPLPPQLGQPLARAGATRPLVQWRAAQGRAHRRAIGDPPARTRGSASARARLAKGKPTDESRILINQKRAAASLLGMMRKRSAAGESIRRATIITARMAKIAIRYPDTISRSSGDQSSARNAPMLPRANATGRPTAMARRATTAYKRSLTVSAGARSRRPLSPAVAFRNSHSTLVPNARKPMTSRKALILPSGPRSRETKLAARSN
jgi:hypothetical protein